jgi:serine/threonine protein kinase
MIEAPQSGVVLGRYTLLAPIASGGMATVHLARVQGELGFTRHVAVKLLHPHLVEDAETVTRFLDEARVASHVKHPHVVTVLDVGQVSGKPFLVLDYVHGSSLDALLPSAGRIDAKLPLPIVSSIFIDVLEGLHAAHEAVGADGAPLGVVHRDVSPQNVLVSDRGVAYITDFGIAKVKDRVRMTSTSDALGKATYMAPEQLAGERVSRSADIYAAGVVLWEALVGERLFERVEERIQAALTQRSLAPPSTRRTDVPRELDALVLSMLARDPASRPRSAAECASALARIVPRAAPSEVADWVSDHARARLDRLDVVLRGEIPVPSAPHDIERAPSRTPTSRRQRVRIVALVSVLALVTAAFGLGLAFARVRGEKTREVAAPELSASTAAAPTPAAPLPAETPLVGTASSSPTASVAAPPSSSVRRDPRAKTTAAAPARETPGCDPPYVVENGLKRWKRDCFTKAPP